MSACDRRLRSTLLVVCATGLAACGMPKSIVGSDGNTPAEPSTAQSQRQSGTDTTDDPRVVKIIANGVPGTGWVYAEGVVVTAAHVIEGRRESIKVKGVDGEPRCASLRSDPEDSPHDIAVLCVEGVADPAWHRTTRSLQTCDLLGTRHYPTGKDQQQRCCPVLAPNPCCRGPFPATGFWAPKAARDEPTFESRQGFFVQRFDPGRGEFGHTLDTDKASSGAPIFAPCGPGGELACLVGMHLAAAKKVSATRPASDALAGRPLALVECEGNVWEADVGQQSQFGQDIDVNIGVDIETIDAFVKDVLSKKPCP